MAAMLDTEFQITARLVEDLGGLSDGDRAWVQRVVSCFPVPTVREIPCLFGALQRLANGVPWAKELLPDDDFLEPLGRLAPLISQLPVKHPGVYGTPTPSELKRALRGDFLRAATLHGFDAGFGLTKSSEALRLVLLACHWRWAQSANPRISIVDDLSGAIRGTQQSAVDQQLQSKMGRARTLADFIEAASGIGESGHATLASIWRLHIDPELRGIARPVGPRRPSTPASVPAPPKLPTPIPPAPRPRRVPRSEPDSDELVDRLQAHMRRGAPPRPAGVPDPLPGEPEGEVSPSLLTVPLEDAPANSDLEALARYQVQQAIWSTNYLLLPNHPDVLPYVEFVRAVNGVVGVLRDPATETGVRYGACGLLLQALLGRTPRTLTGVDVLENGGREHDPRHLEVLLAEGGLRLSAFWQVPRGKIKPSYFRPDEKQLAYLEEVGSHFLLPVAPAILELFRANQDLLRAFSETPVAETEGWLRQAAICAGEAQGLRFTSGQLRSSASSHLFEQCRDVAATQLICADTLGQPISSLAYYAPKASALADIHWKFQAGLLGFDEPPPRALLSEQRVGAQLVVRSEIAQAMARSLADSRPHGPDPLSEQERADALHRAQVNHLSGMLMAVVTHRPTEALFEITLSDVWIEGDVGAALFRDKVCDAAHDPRLVALPATVCRQIQAYLEHLTGLAEKLPNIRPHVSAVLAGKRPLLFQLTDQGLPKELRLAEWKKSLPPTWQEIPANWGRHWVRTHAVEKGISPELVNIQMGHLEIVGYPFSGSSPTEPREFVEALAPAWEGLAQAQGWKVVKGLRPKEPSATPTLNPLHAWSAQVKDHEAAQRAVKKRWREAMTAKLREYRDAAEAMVLAHQGLMAAGITTRYHDKRTRLEEHSLTRQDFERIRDEMFDDAGDDVAMAIARANALCRIAKVVNRRTRQMSETPGPVLNLRRPLDNAFVPGMMEAVRQVHALRDHVATLVDNESAATQVDMVSACARTLLAMVFFGYCDQPQQILGAFERRKQLQRSARMPDVVLVPWGDAPHEVLALRGLAAMAFSRLAWKFGKEPVPRWGEVEERLLQWLPAWALKGTDWRRRTEGSLVTALCETAGMVHRYELSPAARRANGIRGGSTPAHIREQLAFLDGDPAGTIHRNWESTQAAAQDQAVIPLTVTAPGPRKGNARSQYLRLCAAFPDARKDTPLPLTNELIPSGEAASTASVPKVLGEIQSQMKLATPDTRLQPIVQMLAGWVEDMLLHGTPKTDEPALVTIETYLTRIGGPLVHIFGQSAMEDVDEVELEEAYLASINAKNDSRAKTAAAVLVFHRFAQAHCGLPEVDLSGIYLFFRDDPDARADARLILPTERTAIIARLSAQAKDASSTLSSHSVRVLRQASQVMPLIAMAGPRRSEALGLQFRDVMVDETSLRARIRPNRSRRLKTFHARRVVEVPLHATSTEGAHLADWIAIERQRLPARRLETAYVFSASDTPFSAIVRTEIAEACLQACREVTGRRLSRLHSFRHLVAMERMTAPFLSEADFTSLSATVPLVRSPTMKGQVVLPRDLQAQVVGIGHSDPSTTLTWYHHLPWLLRSRAESRLAATYLKRDFAASLLGVTRHALDWASKQRPGRPRGLAWLDVQCDARTVPATPISVDSHRAESADVELTTTRVRGNWTAVALGGLLAEVTRVGSLEKTLLVRGDAIEDAERIRLGFFAMEQRLGRGLLHYRDRASGSGRPQRMLRRIGKGIEFELLWEWFDSDAEGQREGLARLADAMYEFMNASQADRIYLPAADASELFLLLERLEIQKQQIVVDSPEGGLKAMRILREDPASTPADAPPSAERYLGLALKRVLLLIRLAKRLE